MGWNVWALSGVTMLALATVGLGVWGSRTARATSDFLTARQSVRAQRNAAAISGEYLSAASFLGIAGLLLKDGVDALWYPIGFASGYLALMLFVAAPLRRSGAYTLPDFAEARLGSLPLRWLSTVFVVLIGWLYLVPQLQAAGLALSVIARLPYWTGVVAVVVSVLVSVLTGGMRAVTLVQAFQYWVKLFAITLPAFAMLMVFMAGGAHQQPDSPARGLDEPAPPIFEHDTNIQIDNAVRLRVVEPVWLRVSGNPEASTSEEGQLGDGPTYAQPGEYSVPEGTELRFPAGSPVPVVTDAVADNDSWLHPQQHGLRGLLKTYSLVLATFLGTMGLPHVLVRFYTNPSGSGARRTALFVLALLGTFYLFPTIFGLLSRLYVPQLLVTGRTDMAVLMLPDAMLGGWLGGLLGAITAAGAFAAFLSTCSGLVVSLAGVLSKDVLQGRVRDFRLVAVVAAVVPALLALRVSEQDITQSVGMAFALAASTFGPLLVLGVWWRGLTAAGAASGLVAGGGLVLAVDVLTNAVGTPEGWYAGLLEQPALVSVPVTFLVTYLVSRSTRHRVPDDVSRVMLRMHAPDRLGFVDGRGEASSAAEQPSGRHRKREE